MRHDAHLRQPVGVVGVHHRPVVDRPAQVGRKPAAGGEHESRCPDPPGGVEPGLVLDEIVVALAGDRDVVVPVVAQLHWPSGHAARRAPWRTPDAPLASPSRRIRRPFAGTRRRRGAPPRRARARPGAAPRRDAGSSCRPARRRLPSARRTRLDLRGRTAPARRSGKRPCSRWGAAASAACQSPRWSVTEGITNDCFASASSI